MSLAPRYRRSPLALVLLGGCSSPAPASLPAPAQASAPAPASAPASALAPAPASAPPALPSVQPTAALPPSPPLPELKAPDIPAEESGFRAGESLVMPEDLAKEGVVVPERLRNHGGCARRKVGARQGLLCLGGAPSSERTGHSVMSMSLLVIEGKTLREALSFPQQARALDFPEAVYATLRVAYDEAQGLLTLSDGTFPCEAATRSTDDSLEYQRVVDRLCKARGVYRLSGGVFVRKETAPPLRWPGGPRRPAAPPATGRGSSF